MGWRLKACIVRSAGVFVKSRPVSLRYTGRPVASIIWLIIRTSYTVNPDSSESSSRKRYIVVANSLIRNIVDGEYVVGSLLPTELELSERYGVSRHTIRAALAVLQEHGYISRRKSVGTRVESATPSSSYVHAVDSIDGLVRTASTEVRSIESVDIVTLDRSAARHLMAPLESHWVRLSGPRVDPKTNVPLDYRTDQCRRIRFYPVDDSLECNVDIYVGP